MKKFFSILIVGILATSVAGAVVAKNIANEVPIDGAPMKVANEVPIDGHVVKIANEVPIDGLAFSTKA